MNPLWKKRDTGPTRHVDPNVAIAAYLEELRRAEFAGAPTSAAALNGLGDAHLDKGDAISAVDYYRQAAEVYEREGMHDNAIACCKKIRRHAPNDEDTGLMLGRYYAAKGMRADALVELETYVQRKDAGGQRRDVIEGLREILRLDPLRTDRREQLGRALAEDGANDRAKAEYSAALERYRSDGDAAGMERMRSALAALAALGGAAEASTPPPVEAARSPGVDGVTLELEPTAYALEPPAPGPPAVTEGAPISGAALPGDPLYPGPPRSPDEAAALAARHAAAGRMEPAARHLAAAALGFRDAGRWPEAVVAYRRLAQIERATPEDFAAWAECARQAGDGSRVMEALAATARWNLARQDHQAARRAAEEMLLLDPESTVATDILEQVGTSLPRN